MLKGLTSSITAPYSTLEAWGYDHLVAPALEAFRNAVFGPWVSSVPQGAKILDVGCGGGQNLLFIAKARPDVELVGLDLSPDQVRRAEERARAEGQESRVRFVRGTALQLPFKDGTFDRVFSIASLKHWPEMELGLSECVRVTKSGGELSIAEVDRSCRFDDARRFVDGWKVPSPLKPIALGFFRTWVAGSSVDLEEARALTADLPLQNLEVGRIHGTPGLLIQGAKR